MPISAPFPLLISVSPASSLLPGAVAALPRLRADFRRRVHKKQNHIDGACLRHFSSLLMMLALASNASVRRRLMSAQREEYVQDVAEVELIARCGRGDTHAFDLIVAKHQDRVFNLCFWMLHDRDEALDAAQDAFVRAFRALEKGKFRGDSSLGTWLHRIASNVALDAARKKKNRPLSFSSLSRPDDDAPDDPEPTPEDAPPLSNPEEAVARREKRAAIRQALAELPEHHRLALVMFDIEGHSYEQIGELLNLPIGTVKSRLNRARAALRDKLEARRELWDAG